MKMTICSLTPSKVLTAKKRKKPYIIHDQKLRGFHLKIYPSGRKTFAITCLRGGKQYNERIGDAAVMTVADARSIAITKIDALTLTAKACKAGAGTGAGTGTGTSSLTNTSFSTVAEVVFTRYERRWKSSTMRVNRDYLKNQLLPFFGGKNIASITRANVERWFAGLSHITEGANRAVPVLSTIIQGAEELGLREEDSNPTLGLKRYKRYPQQCVLTDMEMARLGKLLDAEAGKKICMSMGIQKCAT